MINKTKRFRPYYLILLILAIMIPFLCYPYIFGVDAFELIWMANAIKEGALFSENTWLIHPTSYFGYYPFSHRAIGIPLIIAYLLSFLNLISVGIFGISEVILVYNIILIIVFYKASRSLGNTLFNEEWSRFMFTGALLFAPHIIDEFTMTISTRIVITIFIILILNFNLKIISGDYKINYKDIIYILLIFILGALIHRLWLGMIIPFLFTLIIFIIRKNKNILKLILIFILPLIIICFFLGLSIFGIMPRFELNNSSLIQSILFFLNYYGFNLGLISLFFPIGIIIMIYKISIILKKKYKIESSIFKEKKFLLLQKNLYLILFIIPFIFLSPQLFYALTLFSPMIIIISINGLIYIKNYISSISKTVDRFLPSIVFLLLFGFYLVRIGIFKQTKINLVFLLLFSIGILIILISISIKIHHKKNNFHLKLRKEFWIITLIIPFLTFTMMEIQMRNYERMNSSYPWENNYLTNEEKQIINYFQNKDLNGLIFVCDDEISARIGGIGFLPTFHGLELIGLCLWYGVVSPEEIHMGTKVSSSLLDLIAQYYYFYKPLNANWSSESWPLEVLKLKIIKLNMTYLMDCLLIQSEYNIQYVVTIKQKFTHFSNEWILIESLYQSDLEPIFSTQHFLVWNLHGL